MTSDDDFIACYQQHYARIVRALELAGAGAEAEDIAQEAFSVSMRHWHRVRIGPSPAGYVYRVAFRRFFNLRARSQTPTIDITESHEASTVLTLAVEAALSEMPNRQRAAAVLCLILGYNSTEAGELMGAAPATVRKHVEAARRDIKKALSRGVG